MNFVLANANVFIDNGFHKVDILISDGIIADISDTLNFDKNIISFDLNNCYIFPGLIDVHVHLREPGFCYKENLLSGTLAAARGGFTDICAMPNLNPAPDSLETVNSQLMLIKEKAAVNVYPYGTVTKGEKGEVLSDMEEMADYVVAFSDDGKGVQNDDIMIKAMEKAKKLGKIIAAHCEDNSLLDGGYIHKGEYARLHNHKGICSESEWMQVKRDIDLVRKTGCKYHVCHVSTKESVELVRQAKKEGLSVSCETAPHYLVFTDMDLKEDGRFKMNPPIRSKEDRAALIEGIKDGTIEIIATDHAPHSKEEKSKGLEKSLMGIVGLETAFPVLYTNLVKTGVITLEKLIDLMSTNPRKRFGIGSEIKVGAKAALTVYNLDQSYTIDSREFLSKGKSTPFEGMNVFGKCRMTILGDNIVWQDKEVKAYVK